MSFPVVSFPAASFKLVLPRLFLPSLFLPRLLSLSYRDFSRRLTLKLPPNFPTVLHTSHQPWTVNWNICHADYTLAISRSLSLLVTREVTRLVLVLETVLPRFWVKSLAQNGKIAPNLNCPIRFICNQQEDKEIFCLS